MKLLTTTDRYLAKLIALPLFSTLLIAAMLLVVGLYNLRRPAPELPDEDEDDGVVEPGMKGLGA